ncbi:MAG: carboxyl transferase domain-containing protein, partial [Ilumatobacteraceae bacterium]
MTALDDTPFPLSRLVPASAHADVRVVDGRRVVWAELAESDDPVRMSSQTASILEGGLRTALAESLPAVLVISTAGADIVEGVSALHGWGRAAAAMTACSGTVPTFVIIDGPAVSGPALLLGLADFTVMTEASYAFVNGPVMVEQFTGVGIANDELGGAANHARYTGVPAAVVADREAAVATVEDLLAYLPGHVDEEPPR